MQYVFPFLVSFGIVVGMVPFVKKYALYIGFVDLPSHRKIHVSPIPLMGGVAIYTGCVVAILIFEQMTPLSMTVLTGGTILLAIGLLDDWFKTKGKEFPVWPRLIIYMLVSIVPLIFGVEIMGITNLYTHGMIFFPVWLVWLATAAWVFGITNMINFMDGVDGLASGIVTISSLTLLITAILKKQEDSAVMAVILVGACLAFLVFNFYPAKIFMGDAGAIFIGYTLSVTAINGAFKSATFLTILVPFLAIAVPIIDTIIVFSRRFMEGKGFHQADKLHTHHSLMRWGLTQTQTVSFLYLIGVLFSLLSLIVVIASR
jgi:UDP-GlcNAc:undecaprenyl-phosphate GlcNAc-1-phosphate transferase